MKNKEKALDFLRLAASGNVQVAYRKYVGTGFKHHNPFFRGDAESLSKGMEENAGHYPLKVFEPLRALSEGDLVVVHSHVRLKPGDLGIVTVHIFKFHQGQIVELWDIGQPVPESSPNENGMF
jgi:predicted SnoaL-like aldol condensation-catalyzing enzyme